MASTRRGTHSCYEELLTLLYRWSPSTRGRCPYFGAMGQTTRLCGLSTARGACLSFCTLLSTFTSLSPLLLLPLPPVDTSLACSFIFTLPQIRRLPQIRAQVRRGSRWPQSECLPRHAARDMQPRADCIEGVAREGAASTAGLTGWQACSTRRDALQEGTLVRRLMNGIHLRQSPGCQYLLCSMRALWRSCILQVRLYKSFPRPRL